MVRYCYTVQFLCVCNGVVPQLVFRYPPVTRGFFVVQRSLFAIVTAGHDEALFYVLFCSVTIANIFHSSRTV